VTGRRGKSGGSCGISGDGDDGDDGGRRRRQVMAKKNGRGLAQRRTSKILSSRHSHVVNEVEKLVRVVTLCLLSTSFAFSFVFRSGKREKQGRRQASSSFEN